jgi:hypothetical protein
MVQRLTTKVLKRIARKGNYQSSQGGHHFDNLSSNVFLLSREGEKIVR